MKYDDIEYWEKAIKQGILFRETYAESKEWDRYTQHYRNKFAPGILPYNLIYSIGRSVIPQVYFRNPAVLVTATKPGFDGHAGVLQQLDNALLRLTGVKKALKRGVLRAFLYGTAPFKLGYDSHYGLTEKNERIEYDTNIAAGMPWVKSIHPAFYVMPYGVEDFNDKQWEAYKFYRHIDDVKSDDRYSSARKDVVATYKEIDDIEISTQRFDVKPEWVELWEIRDFRSGKLRVYSPSVNKWLRNEDDVLQFYGLPTIGLIFNDDPCVGWGISDCIVIDPQQKELNETKTQTMYHRRIAMLKLLYNKDNLDADEINKLVSNDVCVAVGVRGQLQNTILPVQPHIPPDLIAAAREIRGDVRELTGFSRNQLGEYDISSRRSASEAMIVHQASQIRVDERRDMLADVLVNVIKWYNQSIYTFWTTARVARIVGPEGALYWVSYQPSELSLGDYEYRVDPESQIPMTKALRRREALELLNLFGNDPMVPGQVELRKWVLDHYEGIDANKIMRPPEQTYGQTPTMPVPLQAINQMWEAKQYGA